MLEIIRQFKKFGTNNTKEINTAANITQIVCSSSIY